MADTFTPEIMEEICASIAETGSIQLSCAMTGIPRRTLYDWMETHEELRTAIARAKEVGYDARAEQAVANAKKATDAGLGRLSFDADRWYLSKIDPKRYGDKLDLTTGGEKLAPDLGDAAARAAALLATAKDRKGKG